jgi:hypothetical protein
VHLHDPRPVDSDDGTAAAPAAIAAGAAQRTTASIALEVAQLHSPRAENQNL